MTDTEVSSTKKQIKEILQSLDQESCEILLRLMSHIVKSDGFTEAYKALLAENVGIEGIAQFMDAWETDNGTTNDTKEEKNND